VLAKQTQCTFDKHFNTNFILDTSHLLCNAGRFCLFSLENIITARNIQMHQDKQRRPNTTRLNNELSDITIYVH